MVRSTFFGFEASKSALYTSQKSLDITGNNLANTNTDGYTRQRVETAATRYSSSTSRIASSAVSSSGAGVTTLGVSQVRDAFVDKCYRDENSLSNYYSKSSDILNDILDVFPEGADITDDSGLQGGLENLYSSLNDYIQNPTLDSEANIVKTAFANIVSILHQADNNLTTVATRQTTDMKTTINRTNEILEQINSLNKTIKAQASTVSNTDSEYFGSNELLDERNNLLDELSGYADINAISQNDGTVNVEVGGKLVLSGKGADAITMSVNDNGYVNVAWRSSGESVSLTSGSINAYIEVINGRGSNVQSNEETPTQGIPYYRDRLNTFASALAKVANSTIPVAGSDGNPSTDGSGNIIYKTLLSAQTDSGNTDSTAKVTAANISISDEWTNGGAGYFIYSKSENVQKYAQSLSAKLMDNSNTFSSYGENFSGTFSEYLTDMVGKVGTDVSFNQGRQAAAESVADDFLSQRDSISGVQKDEETANMLQFQKSYEASARMMTVMNDLLDTLINQIGASIG